MIEPQWIGRRAYIFYKQRQTNHLEIRSQCESFGIQIESQVHRRIPMSLQKPNWKQTCCALNVKCESTNDMNISEPMLMHKITSTYQSKVYIWSAVKHCDE